MNTSIDYENVATDKLLQMEREYSTLSARYESLQLAQKILLNSLYGALGNASFRYFDLALAVSVTTSGKHAIRYIERKLNELMDYKTGITKDRIVLIDTDSVVIDMEDLVKKVAPESATRKNKLDYIMLYGEKVINPYIEKSYSELAQYMNAFAPKLKMKRENIINSMVSVAAKSYVMEVYNSEGVQYTLDKPKMKIMGLQLVKSSTPVVIQKALRNALPIMLHGTEEEMQAYVTKVENGFKDFSIEEIAFPRGMNNITLYDKTYWKGQLKKTKDPEQVEIIKDKLDTKSPLYVKKTPVHVKASLLYNDLIRKYGLEKERKKVVDGDKIKFVYLKTPNPTKEECIAFQDTFPKEFKLNKYIDYNTMFEKAFLKTIETMIEPLGWKPRRETYLDDFFSYD